jgi:hypothetical protein
MTATPLSPPRPAVQPGQVFVATFRPHPRWSEDITRHAGLRCKWRAVWRISEGCFAGEMGCVPLGVIAGPSWAPEGELVRE